jgi:hypothetical protein
MMGAYPIGTLVHMNTGEVGIVFDTNPDTLYFLRPKVKLITDTQGNKVDGEVVDLADKDPRTEKFLRTILKALDPEKYDVNVSDYFLARAQ